MRSELAQGGFWVVAGGAILSASWTMDRLENLGVKPFSAPGLLPGVLGIFIVVLGIAMLLRARRRAVPAAAAGAIEWGRIVVPLALCLGFAAGLVGRGMPFWAAAWIYVALTIAVLQYRERRARGELRRLALVALGVGAGASIAITLVFQQVFLIRLP